jgi:AAA ATPase domain
MIGKYRTRNEISGGIFFSAVIQGRDITVVLPREITPAMAGLRDASVVFAGRDGDLEELIGLIDPAAGPTPRTTAVSGLPGVGKTELVLHAAHAALRAGWFPGGVLFIDMFGYTPEPGRKTTAVAALDSLLRAVGMPAEHIPAAEQDRSRLFASVLARYAEEGSPVLLVIDNVSTAAQVTPLIPAAGKVLVTSRHRLPLQNARRLELDKLSEAAGLELLAAELALVSGTDTRVASQSADAAVIARLCDGLPLALQIIAALLAAHPSRPLSSMAADLQDTRTRLDEMRYREPGGAELAVESAFDLSFHQLDAEQARIFRLVPLNQGPEISAAAVAAMTSLGEPAARRSLEELERAHLIEAGSADRHWRMHDLLRVYALGLADESHDVPRAIGLLLAYYVDTVGRYGRRGRTTA